MRILHLLQRPQYSGAEIFASQLAAEHKRRGYEVHLYALFPGEGRILRWDGAPIPDMGADPRKRLMDLGGWRKLHRLIERLRPDIVQANAADTLKYAVVSRRFHQWEVPIVYRNASIASRWIKSPLHRAYNKWLLRQVEAIACVSNASREDLIRSFHLPGSRLFTLPNATPVPEAVDRTQARADVRKDLSLPPDSSILLHIGAFTSEKNQLGLLEIFDMVAKEFPLDLRLLLIGQGPLQEVVREKSQKMGLSQRVVFLGNRRDVPRLLQAASLLVLPSTIEGLPGVILEAMAHQTPIIASRVGGIPEAITDGQSGRLVEPSDTRSFAHAILDLLRDEHQRACLTQNAYRKVRDAYHIETVSAGFLELYRQLLPAHAPL